MKRSTLIAATLLVALTAATSVPATAGPYADDMAKCLVQSTSPADRTVLVKWIFAAIALHPDLASLANISAQQRDAIDKQAGSLVERLLLDSCRAQLKQAVQYEGPQSIQYAFQILGQVATRGLFTDPRVAAGLKDLGKNVDQSKLKALLNPGTTN